MGSCCFVIICKHFITRVLVTQYVVLHSAALQIFRNHLKRDHDIDSFSIVSTSHGKLPLPFLIGILTKKLWICVN